MSPPVPFFDPRRGIEHCQREMEQAVAAVIAGPQWILGPQVETFEQQFANFLGVKHAVGCNSGTDAIQLALRALGIGPGDEVITVANAGVPPIAAIRQAGAMPRLVDIEPDTLLIDAQAVAAAIGPRTRAILAIHLYGQPVDMEALSTLAQRHGLALIEDCAQALGAIFAGRPVGSLGTIGCFSFYPTKNLGAVGDAGLCVTSDPDLAQKLRRLRQYGFDDQRSAQSEGINSRMDELQAALLSVRLPRVTESVAQRRRLAARYRSQLTGGLAVPLSERPGRDHAYHLFVILTERRDDLRRSLDAHKIGYGLHYPTPVHRMPAYQFLADQAGDLTVTESAAERVLSLPLYPELRPEEQDRVIAALRSLT